MFIRYLFEDREESFFSKFFRLAYSTDINFPDRIVYSEGNGNLEDMTLLIADYYKNDQLVVFIDLLPDNLDTVEIFKRIITLILNKNFNNRVTIVPLISAEYYYIKLLYNLGKLATGSHDIVKHCLSREPFHDKLQEYADSMGLNSRSCTTYERFCKWICANCLKDCARVRGPRSEPMFSTVAAGSCKQEIFYYCEDKGPIEKARDYSSLFPVPHLHFKSDNSFFTNLYSITMKQLLLHNTFVDRYEADILLYNEKSTITDISQYKFNIEDLERVYNAIYPTGTLK